MPLLSRYFAWIAVWVLLVPLVVSPAAAQSIADARQAGSGSDVTVQGVVTRAFGDYVRLQDASGNTGASGLTIRQTEGDFNADIADGTIALGTVLTVSGTLSEFNGLLQINDTDLQSYSIDGTQDVPAPQVVSLAALQGSGEDYESELVRVTGLALEGAGATFDADRTYAVTDGADTFDLRVQGSDETELPGTPAPQAGFDYTGIVGQFDSEEPLTDGYQLIPVRTSDLQPSLSFAFNEVYDVAFEGIGAASVNVLATNVPDGETVSVTADITAGSATGADVSGATFPQTFSFTGSDGAPQALSLQAVADGVAEGTEFLTLTLTSSDGPTVGSYTVWIADDTTATATLYPDLEGQELLDQIQADFGNPVTLGYGTARDSMYRTIFNENGIVRGYYSGYEVTVDPEGGDASNQALDQGVNTEHTYPQSLGAGDEPQRSNIHILVPARDAVNSARSNYAFGDIPDDETDRWYRTDQSTSTLPPASERDQYSEVDTSPSDRDDRRFEPRERVKGDIARKVFYFRAIYPNESDRGFLNLQFADLLEWNQIDPPDSLETARNAIVAAYQSNKLNPFVLDPTLAERAFAPDGVYIPDEIDVSIDVPFSGLDNPANYRLVALPGDPQLSVAQALDGQQEQDWRLFWDTGASSDFLQEYEQPGRTFTFQAGRGFWLIQRTDWTYFRTIDTVPLTDGVTTIDLHDGWNIIANPLDQPVAWADVEAANGGALQPIWAWNGGFGTTDTFSSAQTGEAFYFLNDGGLEQLAIPYPGAKTSSAARAASHPAIALQASVKTDAGDSLADAVRLQFHDRASEGRDAYDHVAPTTAFSTLTLRLAAPDAAGEGPRRKWLAQEARPLRSDGQSFRVRLTNDHNAPVTFRATGLDALPGASVVLLDAETSRRYDLTSNEVQLTAVDDRTYTLLVGSKSYVEAAADEVLPKAVSLSPPSPNPVRSETLFRYDLPKPADVSIAVFDVLGRQVATLADGRHPAGSHTVRWTPRSAPSGMYFVRLTTQNRVVTQKVVVVR